MKIAICGNFGANNLGDELILKGEIKMLRDIYDNVEITVLSGNPKNTKANHRVEAVKMFPSGIRSLFKDKKATKKLVEDSDIFILGGGGLFAGPEKRANLIWYIQAQSAGKTPLLCLGQSIGSTRCRIIRAIIRKTFNKAKGITVRDKSSIRRLKEFGVKKEAHLMHDFAFRGIKEENRDRKKMVAIALRTTSKNQKKLIGGIVETIKEVKKLGFEVRILEFDKSDKKLTDELEKKLGEKLQVERGESIINIIAESELLIGMRLHSIITAVRKNTPFLAISYATKVSELLKNYSLDENIIEDDKIDIKRAREALEQKEKTKTKLKNLNKKINDDYQSEKKLLKSLIDNSCA